MVPYLVTAPTAQPVSIEEVKDDLNLISSDKDQEITARIASAVARLDGWGGLLGRCIMPQTWAVDVTGKGPHLLPFPEASEVVATGTSGALDVTQKRTLQGPTVELEDAADDEEIVIQFESGMSAERLPHIKDLIKLMVRQRFDHHDAHTARDLELAIQSMVASVRWRQV